MVSEMYRKGIPTTAPSVTVRPKIKTQKKMNRKVNKFVIIRIITMHIHYSIVFDNILTYTATAVFALGSLFVLKIRINGLISIDNQLRHVNNSMKIHQARRE